MFTNHRWKRAKARHTDPKEQQGQVTRILGKTRRSGLQGQGVFFQLPTHPDSGPFHAALRHFSLQYVSIPAKKCLAQRKNSSLPVSLGVGRIHPREFGAKRYSRPQRLFFAYFFLACQKKVCRRRHALCRAKKAGLKSSNGRRPLIKSQARRPLKCPLSSQCH